MSAAIIITLTGGYLDRLGMINVYRKWLEENGAEFSCVKGLMYSAIPSAIIFKNADDATAFKLKFGL